MKSEVRSTKSETPTARSPFVLRSSYFVLLPIRRARLAAILLIVAALACVVGPYLVAYGPNEQHARESLAPPTWSHPMGTDLAGRDLLARVLTGGRLSLMVGLLAAAVSCTIGVVYGSASGLAGGRVDAVMMRVVDVLYGLPYMLLVIVLMTIFGRSLVILFVAIGCVSWLTMARIVRGQAASLRERLFVEAARAVGLGNACLSRPPAPSARPPTRSFSATSSATCSAR